MIINKGNSSLLVWVTSVHSHYLNHPRVGSEYFVMSYGLWKGKEWAWTITVILSFIGMALGIVSIATANVGAIFHVIINGVILY